MKKLFTYLLLMLLVLPIGALAGDCVDEDGDDFYVEGEDCEGVIGYNGEEPEFCDCPLLAEGEDCHGDKLDEDDFSDIFNPSKVTVDVEGRDLNPKADDIPENYIDEDCKGGDASRPGGNFNLENMIKKILDMLTMLVSAVSVGVLIWGGIMYATAAGEEEKTRKARKAMTGALIGLVVGLSAYGIINYVADKFV